MISRNALISFILLVVLQIWQEPVRAAGRQDDLSCRDDRAILSIVERLGQEENVYPDLERLTKTPVVAACYLIRELRVIPETVIMSWNEHEHKPSMHVIWSLRALRYITGGLEFRAKTKYEIEGSEGRRKYFLTYKTTDDLPFFAVWPSRDSVYISPPDTQAAIIEKWRRWYSESGQTFAYKASQRPNEWYFFLE